MDHSSHFHMPGAFHFDGQSATSGVPVLSAGIIRVPSSPSASSSGVLNLGRSTGSLTSLQADNSAAAKRKRNPTGTRESTPLNDWTSMNTDTIMFDDTTPPTTTSETGSRQIRYTLAGQIETPTGLGRVEDPMADSFYSDIDYRRALGSTKRPHDAITASPERSSSSRAVAAAAQQQPAKAGIFGVDATFAVPQKQGGRGGLTALAFSAIGGVVGKVWEFCMAGAFRGFSAGGGMGYNARGEVEAEAMWQQPTPAPSHGAAAAPTLSRNGSSSVAGRIWCNEHDVPTLEQEDVPYDSAVFTTFPPDCISQDRFRPQQPQQQQPQQQDRQRRQMPSTPDLTTRPAVKRRQTSDFRGAGANGHQQGEAEELRRNWVMVDDRAGSPVPAASNQAKKRTSALSAAPPTPTRGPSRAGGPRYASATTSSSTRRISVPVSRLGAASSSSPGLARRPSSRISHAGSASLTAREPASFAGGRRSSPAPTAAVTAAATTAFMPVVVSPVSRIPVPVGGKAGSSRPSTPTTAVAAAAATTATATTTAATAAAGHRRVRSMASPRRRASAAAASTAGTAATPAAGEAAESSPRLDAEAKRIAARRVAEEREQDLRMEALNAQLRQMIRQGREALGTRVTVEITGGGGGGGDLDLDLDFGVSSRGRGGRRVGNMSGAWVDDDEDDEEEEVEDLSF